MAEADDTARLTEPDTVRVEFCDDINVDVREGTVRLTGMVDLTVVGYDGPEQRIVFRAVMLPDTAKIVFRELRKHFWRSGGPWRTS